ncbi:hypothetical protein V8E36_001667 [Tilletia maclaganii]
MRCGSRTTKKSRQSGRCVRRTRPRSHGAQLGLQSKPSTHATTGHSVLFTRKANVYNRSRTQSFRPFRPRANTRRVTTSFRRRSTARLLSSEMLQEHIPGQRISLSLTRSSTPEPGRESPLAQSDGFWANGPNDAFEKRGHHQYRGWFEPGTVRGYDRGRAQESICHQPLKRARRTGTGTSPSRPPQNFHPHASSLGRIQALVRAGERRPWHFCNLEGRRRPGKLRNQSSTATRSQPVTSSRPRAAL